jgi:hypothetical protein
MAAEEGTEPVAVVVGKEHGGKVITDVDGLRKI